MIGGIRVAVFSSLSIGPRPAAPHTAGFRAVTLRPDFLRQPRYKLLALADLFSAAVIASILMVINDPRAGGPNALAGFLAVTLNAAAATTILRRQASIADNRHVGPLRRTTHGFVPTKPGVGRLTKAVMDRSLALVLLLWMTPLLLLIAVAVRLDSRGPVLFRQRRAGVHGREFDIYKFRTMAWAGQAAADGAVQTRRDDDRITRVGAFLRSSSLDEVPQLINVLNGTMSLVGPRPHPVAMRTEQRLGEEIVPDYVGRLRVKPGITGWAQVNGLRGATETAEQLRRRVEHDNFYIENWSLRMDLRIIAATPASLLLHRNNAF